MSPPELHGGDVTRMASELKCDPSELLDFSANVNSRGLPPAARAALIAAVQSPALMLRYPDAGRHPLRRMLAERFQVDGDCIVLGAGASALIADAVRAIRPSTCLLLTPAFAEYRRVSDAIGAHCLTMPLWAPSTFKLPIGQVIDTLRRTRPDLLFLNNPHNPSGALTPASDIRSILDAAEEARTTILLDEAFIDYAPQEQLTAEAAGRSGLICIRSLTKFYGCPALRIGFAVARPSIAGRMEQQMPAWPLGSLAMEALAQAIVDEEYATTTRQENELQRALLITNLTGLGLFVYPSSTNFLLLKLPPSWPNSRELRTLLLRRHRILVRDCSSFENLEEARHIRVAVLSAESNKRLIAALDSCGQEFGRRFCETAIEEATRP